MGIIKAAISTIGGTLADQWLDAIEPDTMSDTTVMTQGVMVSRRDKRGTKKTSTPGVIPNGSVIHVYPNQFMILVDGGKIIDYTAEEGYYKVEASSSPSLFGGKLETVLAESYNRFKFGGVSSGVQKVYYINLKEIKGIKFGTATPINYFDSFYNAELYLRAFGTYSVKITDPIKLFVEVLSYSSTTVDIDDINQQYLSEFLSAFQSAVNQMSADGLRISYVSSKSAELSKYMSDILDDQWTQLRGMLIQSVGIANISYDEQSKKLLEMRSQGAMLSDPTIRAGYTQGSIARGIEAAGSNASGAANGFLGVGLGVNQGGNFMSAFAQPQPQTQPQPQQTPSPQSADTWKCNCGKVNPGKFCMECGAPKPVKSEWICSCGVKNERGFCMECGRKRPSALKCDKCGYTATGSIKFCPECGAAMSNN